MNIDPTELGHPQLYRLLTGCVVPRPIALVTTLSPTGPNAAPFSFFNIVATDPGTISISVGDRDGQEKDTYRNILKTQEFVVHVCTEEMAERMNVCSADFPASVNELERAGFVTVPSVRVSPPRIADSPVHLECKLTQIIELGKKQRHHLILGEIVYLHFHDGLLEKSFTVDGNKLRAIGRLGGSWYSKTSERFKMNRPVTDVALQKSVN